MEIERKFLVNKLPENINDYNCRTIEQGYLSTNPVVRVRRDNNHFYLTYKGSGMMVREEYNFPLTQEAYEHMLEKVDGNIITKKRYEIPFHNDLTIELDLFEGIFSGTVIAEVEFESEAQALAFTPPDWFGDDVTNRKEFHNSNMSKQSKGLDF